MKVNIVLSTYNGARFLAEQLESIQKQTFTDWQLLIRDDGSTDTTPQIISEFVAADPRIRFINEHDRQNVGVIKNFFTLVKYDAADYYFFSDQDDVWLPDKMATMLSEATKHKSGQPLMVYMDLSVVDQDLNVIQPSMIRNQSRHANTTLLAELTENTVTGGVAMFNHDLAEKWVDTDDIVMHDWYLALLATATGKLVYINKPGELYRQHDNNVLGARTGQKFINLLRQRPKEMANRYWQLIHHSQIQGLKIVKQDLREISSKDIELMTKFADIDKQPISERIRRLITYKFTKNKWQYRFAFRLLILTNWYNDKK